MAIDCLTITLYKYKMRLRTIMATDFSELQTYKMITLLSSFKLQIYINTCYKSFFNSKYMFIEIYR